MSNIQCYDIPRNVYSDPRDSSSYWESAVAMTPLIYCETVAQGFNRKRVNHTRVIYTSWGVAQDNDVTLTS